MLTMPQYKLLKYAFIGINIKPSKGKPGFITFKMTESQFQQFQANQANGVPPQESCEAGKADPQSNDNGESIQVTVDESENYLHVLS